MVAKGDGDRAAMRVDLTEAARGADAPTAPTGGPKRSDKLVEREEPFTIRYRNPQGEQLEADVISRIMDKDDRHRLDRLVAMEAGGPVEHLPGKGWRLISCFRVAIQLQEPPQWLLEAVQEDDDLLLGIMGGLEAHRLRYFRGDDGEGGIPEIPTHVEVVPHSQSLRPPEQK